MGPTPMAPTSLRLACRGLGFNMAKSEIWVYGTDVNSEFGVASGPSDNQGIAWSESTITLIYGCNMLQTHN